MMENRFTKVLTIHISSHQMMIQRPIQLRLNLLKVVRPLELKVTTPLKLKRELQKLNREPNKPIQKMIQRKNQWPFLLVSPFWLLLPVLDTATKRNPKLPWRVDTKNLRERSNKCSNLKLKRTAKMLTRTWCEIL